MTKYDYFKWCGRNSWKTIYDYNLWYLCLCLCLLFIEMEWRMANGDTMKIQNVPKQEEKERRKKNDQSLNSSIGVAFIISFALYLLCSWFLRQFLSSNPIYVWIVFGSMFLVLKDCMDMLLQVESNPTQIVGQLCTSSIVECCVVYWYSCERFSFLFFFFFFFLFFISFCLNAF